MRRARRDRKVGKHISISATDADWETVRRNAKRRGLSIARYLVELVERDASEEDAGPALALAAEEQREQLECQSAFNMAQLVNRMRHLVTAAARQARSLAPGARATRWNQLR